MTKLIFSHNGLKCFTKAVSLVGSSSGIERTRSLAQSQAELAIGAIRTLCASEHREALEALAFLVVSRKK